MHSIFEQLQSLDIEELRQAKALLSSFLNKQKQTVLDVSGSPVFAEVVEPLMVMGINDQGNPEKKLKTGEFIKVVLPGVFTLVDGISATCNAAQPLEGKPVASDALVPLFVSMTRKYGKELLATKLSAVGADDDELAKVAAMQEVQVKLNEANEKAVLIAEIAELLGERQFAFTSTVLMSATGHVNVAGLEDDPIPEGLSVMKVQELAAENTKYDKMADMLIVQDSQDEDRVGSVNADFDPRAEVLLSHGGELTRLFLAIEKYQADEYETLVRALYKKDPDMAQNCCYVNGEVVPSGPNNSMRQILAAIRSNAGYKEKVRNDSGLLKLVDKCIFFRGCEKILENTAYDQKTRQPVDRTIPERIIALQEHINKHKDVVEEHRAHFLIRLCYAALRFVTFGQTNLGVAASKKVVKKELRPEIQRIRQQPFFAEQRPRALSLGEHQREAAAKRAKTEAEQKERPRVEQEETDEERQTAATAVRASVSQRRHSR